MECPEFACQIVFVVHCTYGQIRIRPTRTARGLGMTLYVSVEDSAAQQAWTRRPRLLQSRKPWRYMRERFQLRYGELSASSLLCIPFVGVTQAFQTTNRILITRVFHAVELGVHDSGPTSGVAIQGPLLRLLLSVVHPPIV
jgi:hypothetical protein